MDLNRQACRVVEERHLLPKVPKFEEEPNVVGLLRKRNISAGSELSFVSKTQRRAQRSGSSLKEDEQRSD